MEHFAHNFYWVTRIWIIDHRSSKPRWHVRYTCGGGGECSEREHFNYIKVPISIKQSNQIRTRQTRNKYDAAQFGRKGRVKRVLRFLPSPPAIQLLGTLNMNYCACCLMRCDLTQIHSDNGAQHRKQDKCVCPHTDVAQRQSFINDELGRQMWATAGYQWEYIDNMEGRNCCDSKMSSCGSTKVYCLYSFLNNVLKPQKINI